MVALNLCSPSRSGFFCLVPLFPPKALGEPEMPARCILSKEAP